MPAPTSEIVPMAEWRPDMPDLAEATAVATNVVPITSESYGPLNSLAAVSSSAMDAPAIGGVAVQDNAQNVYLFAGTPDKLYEMTDLSTSWVDVSGTAYSTATGDNWSFDLFADTVVATNFGNAPQSFALGVSSVFGNLFTAAAWQPSHAYGTLGVYVLNGGNRYVLTGTGTSAASGGPSGTGSGITDGTCTWNYQSGAPPLARRLCTPKNFLMLGNTSDPVGGLNAQRVWWSAQNDMTTWPAPGTTAAIQVMSDFNDFEGNFGEITGLVDSLANADVAIFFRHAIWRGAFVGPPDIFDFFPIENVRGCPAPNSIVTIGAQVAYLGEDGFYIFDGTTSVPIGTDKFDLWFRNNVAQAYLYNVIGAADITHKAVFWAYPGPQAVAGIPDSLLIYRWDIQRASSAYLGTSAISWLFRILTFGVSMDGMPALGYTDVDTLPASLDASLWVGGASSLGAITGSGELALFAGPALAATVDTQTKQFVPGRKAYVQSARPLIDIQSATNGIGIAFAGRNSLSDPETFGPSTSPDAMGECPQRNDGRYHNAQISIAAGAVWTHIMGVDAQLVPGGLR